MQKASKIILGIDPGTIIMGYGLIEITGSSMNLVDMNVLKLPAKADAYEKLEKIHHKIQQLIRQYKPGSFAIEAPFFGKNVQSMLKLGRAQGVAIAAAMQAGLTVHEYSPKKNKAIHYRKRECRQRAGNENVAASAPFQLKPYLHGCNGCSCSSRLPSFSAKPGNACKTTSSKI